MLEAVSWYARCCNTPIGNTLVDYRISFIGLVHTCLQSPEKLARARITGAYKRTPFFSPDSGAPIVTPKILSADERASVYKNV
jgi:hypothetical protein